MKSSSGFVWTDWPGAEQDITARASAGWVKPQEVSRAHRVPQQSMQCGVNSRQLRTFITFKLMINRRKCLQKHPVLLCALWLRKQMQAFCSLKKQYQVFMEISAARGESVLKPNRRRTRSVSRCYFRLDAEAPKPWSHLIWSLLQCTWSFEYCSQ